MDNPLYEAALEGRYVIDLDVQQDGDEYVARYDHHGLNVEVRDVSAMTASNLASQQILDKLRSAHVFDRMYG